MHSKSIKTQTGMATLLIVIVIGMLLTVYTLSVVYAGRSAQDKQIAVHAVTHSQVGAWSGVDILKNYFESLTLEQRNDLEAPSQLTLSINTHRNYLISINKIDILNEYQTQINATVSYKDINAKSSSQLETVIMIETPQPPPSSGNTGIDVYGDLNIGGDIKLSVPEGTSVLTVDGEVNFDGVDLSSLEKIIATKTIRAGSDIDLDSLWSNEDIVLTGSAKVTNATAIGNIVVQQGSNGSVQDGFANGFIYYNSNEQTNSLSALGLDLNGNQTLNKTVGVCLIDSPACPLNQLQTNRATPGGSEQSFVIMTYGGANITTVTAMGNSLHKGTDIIQIGAGTEKQVCKNAGGFEIDCNKDDVTSRTKGDKFGDVYIDDVHQSGQLTAYGKVNAYNSSVGNVSAYNDVTAQSMFTIDNIKSEGFVTLHINNTAAENSKIYAETGFTQQGNLKNINVISDGPIELTGNIWNVADSLSTSKNVECIRAELAMTIQYGTTINNNCWKANKTKSDKKNLVPALTDKVETLKAKLPATIDFKPYVDMWLLEDQSHFAFRAEYSLVDRNRINRKVWVRDIMLKGTHIENEAFYITRGHEGNFAFEYLCKESEFKDADGSCTGDKYKNRPICITKSGQGCFMVNIVDNKPYWTMGYSGGDTNQAVIPAIYWFEGDLLLKTSRLNATVLVTENITTDGDMNLHSLNYSDFESVCKNKQKELNDAFKILDNSYPKSYCDLTNNKLITATAGNVALGAGGTHPIDQHINADGDKVNTYKGGDITIGGNSEFWGTILVGNEIYAYADVEIHGFFVALGWNDDPTHVSKSNTLNGSLDIIYEDVPDTYDRSIPSATTECENDSNSVLCEYAVITPPIVKKEKPTAHIKWIRYL